MLCVCESCLNVLSTGKQTQTVSRKYRETNNNLGKANKPWENQKNKKHKEPTNKKNNSQRLLAGPPPFLKTSPDFFLFFLVLLFLLFFLMFLAPPRSKYGIALPAATKNIEKILAGNPPPPESLNI